MRKFAFLTLGLSGLLLGTPSCGKDEATGDGGTSLADHCEVCEATNDCQSAYVCKAVNGGNGRCSDRQETQCCVDGQCYALGATLGSGGSGGGILGGGGSSGKGGSSGSGGKGGSVVTSMLGAACDADVDCDDDRLTCLKSDGLADGSGPPKGLCTLNCTTDGACLEFSDNAYCVELEQDNSFCFEGCVTGTAGEPKCHQRSEFACSLLGLFEGTTECEDSGECGANQLCSNDGVCGDIVTGCLPTCGGDFDCGQNQYCDFASGFCVDTKPTGRPIGAACNPKATTEQCDGFCVETNDAGTQGKCEAFCSLSQGLIGCGWDGTGQAEAACLFGTILSPPGDYGNGDLGICGKLCDCNDQCEIPDEFCIDDLDGAVSAIWGRNGYCRTLDAGESASDTFNECPDGSSGGAGGQGAGGGSGAGSAGEGSAGEPSGSSGAGGESGAAQGGQGGA